MSTDPQLKQGLNIVDIIAIGIGAAVGVSIFSIMAPAAEVAGTGMLAATAVAAIPMVVFTVTYAFMGSTVPRSGASFEWPARFVHPFVGFMVAWLRVVGNTGALTVLSLVLVSYASRVVALPQKLTMFLLFVFFFLANLFGIKVAAGVERVLVAFKLVIFGIFVAFGFSLVRMENLHPLLGTAGWAGILGALPLLVSLYMGIESATEVGEEIKNSQAVITRGLAITTVLTIVVYLSVSLVALGILGPGSLSTTETPLYDAGEFFLGRWNTWLIVVGAVASIGTAMNAVYITFTRFLFAMGRDGVLPEVFGRIHPRWGTPHVAVLAVFLIACTGLFLPSSLVFLFLAVGIPTTLKYLCNCWSAWRLVDHHPDLHKRAKFRLSRSAVRGWAGLGIVLALVIIAGGLTADWRPYAILGVWFVLGTVYWVVRGQRVSLSMQAREGRAAR